MQTSASTLTACSPQNGWHVVWWPLRGIEMSGIFLRRGRISPAKAKVITARRGRCPLCGAEVRGKKAIWIISLRKVVCSRCADNAHVVLRVHDDGYHIEESPIEVHGSKPEDRVRELNQLNMKMRVATGFNYTYYRSKPVHELIGAKDREFLVDDAE